MDDEDEFLANLIPQEIILTKEDFKLFEKALEKPQKPNSALRKLFEEDLMFDGEENE